MFRCIDKDLSGVTFVSPTQSITSVCVEDAFVDDTLMTVDDKNGNPFDTLRKNSQAHERYLYMLQGDNLHYINVSGLWLH